MSLASAIISAGLSAIPLQERGRYAEEFEADLRTQPVWGRIPYAASLVLGMPRLRWEVLSRLAGRPVPFCFMGLHRDRTFRPNPEASWVLARECLRCHRIQDTRQYAPRREVNDLRSWYSAHGDS